MLSAAPATMTNVAAFRPVLDMCESVLLKSSEVAQHYRYTEEHLCNLRKRNRGWAFIKLEAGGVRYRLSEILSAELAGTCGPLTIERVCQALAACSALTVDQRALAQEHIRLAFSPPKSR